MADKLPQLQSLRALAAIGVLLHHTHEVATGQPSLNPWQLGQFGVDLFFVLSGFVIHLAHGGDIGNPAKLGRFLSRRAIRIYAPYLIYLAFFAPLALYRFPALRDLPHAVSAILLLPTDHYFFKVAWSLAHEIKFYLFYAILILVPARWSLMICAAAIGATLAAWVAGTDIFLLSPLNLEFGAGVLACIAFRSSLPQWIARAALPVGMAFFAFGCFTYLQGHADRVIVFGIASALVVFGAARTMFRQPMLERVGDASYSLYLLHAPLLFLFGSLLRHTGLDGIPSLYGIGDAVIVALSVAAWSYVERPIVDALRLRVSPKGLASSSPL